MNADNNGGNDVLTRRFFLYDPVTGAPPRALRSFPSPILRKSVLLDTLCRPSRPHPPDRR